MTGDSKVPDINIRNHKDSLLVKAIVVAPMVMMAALVIISGIIVVSGVVTLEFSLVGELPIMTVWKTFIAPVLLFMIVATAILWIFGIMAYFGASSVLKVAKVGEGMIKDYTGLE